MDQVWYIQVGKALSKTDIKWQVFQFLFSVPNSFFPLVPLLPFPTKTNTPRTVRSVFFIFLSFFFFFPVSLPPPPRMEMSLGSFIFFLILILILFLYDRRTIVHVPFLSKFGSCLFLFFFLLVTVVELERRRRQRGKKK